MFFPDRVAAYREIRLVLRPGGTFLFSIWRGLEHNHFAAVVTDALSRRYPDTPPLFLARAPHGHGSFAEIESDVKAADFNRWHLEIRDDISTAVNPDQAAIAYCHGTPLRNEIENREPGGLERATIASTEALRVRYGDGLIDGRISAFVVSAG